MTHVLEVTDLACGYGGRDVIDGATLQVADREFVTVLGSNNAGKSTLINCLSGLVPASRGRIVFLGEDITRLPAHRRVTLGLVQVPEGRQLFPQMSVWENVRLGATAGRPGAAAVRERTDRVLTLFPRLAERSGQVAGSLSGGEQQMLAIGRGLMADPRLLMLDEPSLGLAPLIVEAIFDALSALNAAGMAILLVEQNLTLSLQHARRGLVLERGEVVLSGTADELRDNDDARRAYLGM